MQDDVIRECTDEAYHEFKVQSQLLQRTVHMRPELAGGGTRCGNDFWINESVSATYQRDFATYADIPPPLPMLGSLQQVHEFTK